MKVNAIHSAVDMPSSNLWNNYDHIWDISVPYILICPPPIHLDNVVIIHVYCTD